MENVLFSRTNNHFPEQLLHSSGEYQKHVKLSLVFFGSRTKILDVNI